MEGNTDEERFLIRLARSSFLRFWSWPNLYRDQDIGDGSRNGKEICDLIVVYGNNVLLFSDKRIELKFNQNNKLSWMRWYRSAVTESIKQIHGARRWLTKFNNRVFVDKECKNKLPINLPQEKFVKFRNIVVTHGAELALEKEYHEKSFAFNNQIDTQQQLNVETCTPFIIGKIFEGDFVHVFSEWSIELVLNEFDTIIDFLSYLDERESVFNSRQNVQIKSESDFIQLYYENFDEVTQKFLMSNSKEFRSNNDVCIDKGGVECLYNRPEYRLRKSLDLVGYFWDNLIESFTYHILNGTSEFNSAREKSESEEGIRELANTCRFERRVISNAFIEFYEKIEPGYRGTRVFKNPEHPEKAYLFLCLPTSSQEDYEKHRKFRRDILEGYCRIAKHQDSEINVIIGIACNTRINDNKIGNSFFNEGQDFVMIDFHNYSTEMNESAKELYERFIEIGLINRQRTIFAGREFQFPEVNRVQIKIPMKGSERNQKCPCGSGKK